MAARNVLTAGEQEVLPLQQEQEHRVADGVGVCVGVVGEKPGGKLQF